MANIILGTWSWGAGMFGGDSVFGSHTDEYVLQPVFDAATAAGLRIWDTATAYGLGESERILGSFIVDKKREDFVVSTKYTSIGSDVRQFGRKDGRSLNGAYAH